jgi:hypothetical protein
LSAFLIRVENRTFSIGVWSGSSGVGYSSKVHFPFALSPISTRRADGFHDHCFDAAHLPLQGTPPEAPFHLPDPVLPSSCPFA